MAKTTIITTTTMPSVSPLDLGNPRIPRLLFSQRPTPTNPPNASTAIALPQGTIPYVPPKQPRQQPALTYTSVGCSKDASSSHRSWVFTINHFTDDDIGVVLNLPIRNDRESCSNKRKHSSSCSGATVCVRVIACVQVGAKTCTPHIQGALVMSSPCTRVWLSRLLPRAFLEPMKLPWKQNRNYCLKNQLQIIRDVDVTKQGCRSDIEDFRAAISSGKTDIELLENGFINQVAKFPRFLNFAREAYAKANHRNQYTKLTVIVRWGKAGVGKTRYVWEKHGCALYALVDDSNGKVWFDGYNGEDILLIDEFTPEMVPYNYFLHLLEGYKLRLPVKSRFTYANWSTVYITSNWHPKDWYPKEGYTQALCRRLTRIEHVV